MIYVFLAEGFEEIEALAVVDVLRRAELEVITVGVGGQAVTGAHGITVNADMQEWEALPGGAPPEGLEMIVLPGGMPGTLNLESSAAVRAAIGFCAQNGRYIAAICAAPSILGHMGLLEGKTAVCFPGFEQELKGAKLSSEAVCADGKIITAKGPGAAIPFALKLAEILRDRQVAEKLRDSMQCA